MQQAGIEEGLFKERPRAIHTWVHQPLTKLSDIQDATWEQDGNLWFHLSPVTLEVTWVVLDTTFFLPFNYHCTANPTPRMNLPKHGLYPLFSFPHRHSINLLVIFRTTSSHTAVWAIPPCLSSLDHKIKFVMNNIRCPDVPWNVLKWPPKTFELALGSPEIFAFTFSPH